MTPRRQSLLIALVAALAVAGCVQPSDGSVQQAVKDRPQVQQFLEAHPNASMQTSLWTDTRFATDSYRVSEKCLETLNQSRSYVRVQLTAEKANLTAWVQQGSQEVMCLHGEGVTVEEIQRADSDDSSNQNDDDSQEPPESVDKGRSCNQAAIDILNASYDTRTSELTVSYSADTFKNDTILANVTKGFVAHCTKDRTQDRLVACSFAGLSIYDAVVTEDDSITVVVANTGTRNLAAVNVSIYLKNGTKIGSDFISIPTGEVKGIKEPLGPETTVDDISKVIAAVMCCPTTQDRLTSFTTTSGDNTTYKEKPTELEKKRFVTENFSATDVGNASLPIRLDQGRTITSVKLQSMACSGVADSTTNVYTYRSSPPKDEPRQRGISLQNLTCYNKGGQAHVVASLKNSGTTELDLNPLDMNVRYADTGNINYSLTKLGMSFAQGRLSQDVVFQAGNSDFSEPRSSATYRINLAPKFNIGKQYSFTFVFTDEDGETVSQTCQPRQR